MLYKDSESRQDVAHSQLLQFSLNVSEAFNLRAAEQRNFLEETFNGALSLVLWLQSEVCLEDVPLDLQLLNSQRTYLNEPLDRVPNRLEHA